ncbi:MAG: hypothetical protein OXH76_09285 [Boseongicola sp.]|nr:hypothetical protein [Boseongicola sp.]
MPQLAASSVTSTRMAFTGGPDAVMMQSKARSTMADNVTNELILEHLKQIQGKLSDHDGRFSRLDSQLRAIKAHVAGLALSDLSRDADQASMQVRLDRVERRLELSDAPAE